MKHTNLTPQKKLKEPAEEAEGVGVSIQTIPISETPEWMHPLLHTIGLGCDFLEDDIIDPRDLESFAEDILHTIEQHDMLSRWAKERGKV